jgi:hypothetical protein
LFPQEATRAACFRDAAEQRKNLALFALDVSEEGIRLHLEEVLLVGQEVTIQLESPNLCSPLLVPGIVVWAVPAPDGSCTVGVRFHRPLPSVELEAIVLW